MARLERAQFYPQWYSSKYQLCLVAKKQYLLFSILNLWRQQYILPSDKGRRGNHFQELMKILEESKKLCHVHQLEEFFYCNVLQVPSELPSGGRLYPQENQLPELRAH